MSTNIDLTPQEMRRLAWLVALYWEDYKDNEDAPEFSATLATGMKDMYHSFGLYDSNGERFQPQTYDFPECIGHLEQYNLLQEDGGLLALHRSPSQALGNAQLNRWQESIRVDWKQKWVQRLAHQYNDRVRNYHIAVDDPFLAHYLPEDMELLDIPPVLLYMIRASMITGRLAYRTLLLNPNPSLHVQQTDSLAHALRRADFDRAVREPWVSPPSPGTIMAVPGSSLQGEGPSDLGPDFVPHPDM